MKSIRECVKGVPRVETERSGGHNTRDRRGSTVRSAAPIKRRLKYKRSSKAKGPQKKQKGVPELLP